MPQLKPGDEVRIITHRFTKGPEGGLVGQVVKVGRKYATASYQATRTDWHGKDVAADRTIEFDMETGKERGASTNYTTEVITPNEAARRARHAAAITTLRGGKIRLEHEHGFTLEQIEALAALAASFGPDVTP